MSPYIEGFMTGAAIAAAIFGFLVAHRGGFKDTQYIRMNGENIPPKVPRPQVEPTSWRIGGHQPRPTDGSTAPKNGPPRVTPEQIAKLHLGPMVTCIECHGVREHNPGCIALGGAT